MEERRTNRDWSPLHLTFELRCAKPFKIITHVGSSVNGVFADINWGLTGDSCASPTGIWAWLEGSHWCLGSSLFGGSAKGPWSRCLSLLARTLTLGKSQWTGEVKKKLLFQCGFGLSVAQCSGKTTAGCLYLGRTSPWRITASQQYWIAVTESITRVVIILSVNAGYLARQFSSAAQRSAYICMRWM